MRKGNYKITAFVCGILSCVLLLCGCGGNTGQQETGAGGPTAGVSSPTAGVSGQGVFTGELERDVTIRVLENDTAIERGYFTELIEAFNKAYAEYGIVAVDANMDQYLDLANDGPYGYGPDVLYQANDVLMKYVNGKHILPLPAENLKCYESIPEIAWEAYRTEIDGAVYTCGVPVNVQAPMLYYRKDMLPEDWESQWDDDNNGVPDMLENWNDMYTYSRQIHEQDSSKYGYMRSLYDVYFSSGYLFSYGGYLFGDDNTNPEEVGLHMGEAWKGANVLKQQASIMNEECIDNTITLNVYNKLAEGIYFAAVTTPDVYTTFIKELKGVYEKEGLSAKEAEEKAKENLVMTSLPMLPASGDLSEENPELIDCKSMGGINGYAISSYTKAPNACLAFVEFAASYEMLVLRNQYLGIAPARSDAARDCGEVSKSLYDRMESGNIVIMPSLQETAQIWTPSETFFSDIAKDAFRQPGEQKYVSQEDYQLGLEKVSQQIYDAIYTLTQ